MQALLDENKTLKQSLQKKSAESASGLADELVAKAVDIGGVKVITHRADDLDVDGLRELIDQLRRKVSPLAVVLGSAAGGKVILIAGLSKELVEKGVSAVDWIKASAKAVGGGGGGRPDLAQAGGKIPEKIGEALTNAAEWLKAKIG